MGGRKYTEEQLRAAVSSSYTYTEVVQRLGLKYSGGAHTYIRNKISDLGLDISHFDRFKSRRDTPRPDRKDASHYLTNDPNRTQRLAGKYLRRSLIELGVTLRCTSCGLTEWLGEPIPLDVDHIDGDWKNNSLSNLQFLCPNCHGLKTRKK